MTNLTRERVDEHELRRRFNQGGYYERMRQGDLVARLRSEGHPAPERSGQPFCTRSQMLSYHDQAGSEVARVHQYLRPDGTIGASGRPDPKRLQEGSVVYVLMTKEQLDAVAQAKGDQAPRVLPFPNSARASDE